MKKHGNLFWRIEFWVSDTLGAEFAESTRIEARSYTYSEAFALASNLYAAARNAGKVVNWFSQYLCEDDSSENADNHYNIYREWALQNRERPDIFFESSPEDAIRVLRVV